MAGTTTAMCTSFKAELLYGYHSFIAPTNFTGTRALDVFKIALVKVSPTGTYDANTTSYSQLTTNSDEASGTNYVAGGEIFSNGSIIPTITAQTGTAPINYGVAFLDVADVQWNTATISATGAIIYNSSQLVSTAGTGRAVAVLDFGGTKTSTAGNFTIQFPANTSTTAIIRFSGP